MAREEVRAGASVEEDQVDGALQLWGENDHICVLKMPSGSGGEKTQPNKILPNVFITVYPEQIGGGYFNSYHGFFFLREALQGQIKPWLIF